MDLQARRSWWCFQGHHTIKPLKDGDRCRVAKDIVSLYCSKTLQNDIDAIDANNVRILAITNGESFYDADVTPVLDLVMPNMEEVHLIDIAFDKVHFTRTPKLHTIEIQNLSDTCDIAIRCPNLKHFDMRYWHGDNQRWIDDMLQVATKLETFQSYKLGVYPSIRFASTELREVHLHRSDCLHEVIVWAPKLEFLRLQGCYGLESLEFPSSHPKLGSPRRQSHFMVQTTNSCLSSEVVETLKTHPRVMWEGDEEDEMAGVGGMEAVFRALHGGGGF